MEMSTVMGWDISLFDLAWSLLFMRKEPLRSLFINRRMRAYYMKGQPNRDWNTVPASEDNDHATNWANEAGLSTEVLEISGQLTKSKTRCINSDEILCEICKVRHKCYDLVISWPRIILRTVTLNVKIHVSGTKALTLITVTLTHFLECITFVFPIYCKITLNCNRNAKKCQQLPDSNNLLST